ncbi:exopolyphosphatase [Methanolapillus ohkumae]|uniref:Exopolyphosphatase 1 n=1 Tax=Methanolapillus ohkumae TaxID=3028298 RepID=A0AA96ZWQ7_9EURY|nr:Exopolyphosphatase 1 [Methanosarcinaceae archaeon Am2]
MLFATIDIGSNAVRLLLTNVEIVENNAVFERLTLLRIPIRLGDDAFIRGKISDDKVKTLVKTMCGFREIMDGFNVMDSMACATSALREARNRDDIVKKIKKESGIDIKIIDGKREAKLIYANHIEKNFDPSKRYLYIDVGGGSTEITYVGDGKRKSKSFNVGAIRLKEGLVLKETWDDMNQWLDKNIPKENVIGIGSGGNISSLYLLAKKINNDPLQYEELKTLCQTINGYSFEDRITELGLKPDRADVIIPACRIYLSIMKTCGIQTMHAPIIGLSDGMVHELYQKHKKKFIE